jgi:hypothetical protein
MRQPLPVFKSVLLLLFFSVGFCIAKSQTTINTNNYLVFRSFVNISKPGGGTFNPNDTIEVRYTILVPWYTPVPAGAPSGPTRRLHNFLKAAQIIDTLPANVTFVNDAGSGGRHLRTATNEGVNYKRFTDAADADQADYTVSGANRIVSIKARPATGPKLDTLSGGLYTRPNASSSYNYDYAATVPRLWNGSLVMLTYWVKVNAAYGQYITFNKSSLWFRGTADAAPVSKYRFTPSVVAVYQTDGLCTNGTDTSKIFESNGSFGFAKPKNRATASPIVPTGGANGYTFVNANANLPDDGTYSIVNNSSDSGSINTAGWAPGSRFGSQKIFDIFDVSGDHTGAINPNLGNPPADTAAAAPGGGYALLVNASYATNVAVTQTVTNMCQNTYYELSAWFRNVCPRCAGDSLSNGNIQWGVAGWPNNPGYISYPGNDSAGVRPNLAFYLNDTLFYVTGDMAYDKTGLKPWIKKGFTYFNTSSGSFKVTIANNSPGGGGNDWMMDDVNVSTCGPTLKMNYTPTVLGCREDRFLRINLADTVRYAFNNSYIHFKWQKKTLLSPVWVDVPGSQGIANGSLPQPPNAPVPVMVNGQYQFVTNLASFPAIYADSGTLYRVITATTASNLNTGSNCLFTDGNTTMLNIITCGIILDTKLVNFSGSLNNDLATIKWITEGEKHLKYYEIERSYDQIHFIKIGETAGKNLLQRTNYSFNDNQPVFGNAFYRLKLVDESGAYAYSNVVLLGKNMDFKVRINENPFTDVLKTEIILPQSGEVNFQLIDCFGKLIYSNAKRMQKGFNSFAITNQDKQLSSGMYFLTIKYNGQTIQKKVVKL